MLCAVLPMIASSQQSAHDATTARILRGDLSYVPPLDPDSVRVYLCYDFEGY